MAYYDKQYDIRDRGRAEDILASKDMYADYTDDHLRNALRFANGCAGNEARARATMIKKEQNRRKKCY